MIEMGDEVRMKFGHAFKPTKFGSGCAAQLARYPCPYSEAEHGPAPSPRVEMPEPEGVTNVRRFCKMMLDSISIPQRETAQEVLDLLDADR